MCIGENNWKLVFVSKQSELSSIREFERCGGKVFNPIYCPPKETETYFLHQIVSKGSFIQQFFSRLYSEIVNFLYGFPPAHITHEAVSISCISWKQDKPVAAVAFPDSSVHFYDLDSQKWKAEVLQNNKMIGIQSLCWKSASPATLAVSCVNGVFIWKILKQENGSHCTCVYLF